MFLFWTVVVQKVCKFKKTLHLHLASRLDAGLTRLVYFDGAVYLSHEKTCAPSTDSTAHEKKTNAKKRHISKIERHLQQSRHLRLVEEVEDAVQEDIK